MAKKKQHKKQPRADISRNAHDFNEKVRAGEKVKLVEKKLIDLVPTVEGKSVTLKSIWNSFAKPQKQVIHPPKYFLYWGIILWIGPIYMFQIGFEYYKKRAVLETKRIAVITELDAGTEKQARKTRAQADRFPFPQSPPEFEDLSIEKSKYPYSIPEDGSFASYSNFLTYNPLNEKY